ncbi:MAG: hypothetical protein Q9M43_06455 [Sulfurimonas sp.]|nr:hypothetical protein [Sulfurimonas sp.]
MYLNTLQMVFLGKETIKDVEVKAQEEEKNEEDLNAKLEEAQRLQDLEKETMLLEEMETNVDATSTDAEIDIVTTPTVGDKQTIEEKSELTMQNYYLLGALALLVLVIGGFIIYKKIAKEDE